MQFFYPKQYAWKLWCTKYANTIFQSIIYPLDWGGYSPMWCGNMSWVFAPTESTTRFPDEHQHKNATSWISPDAWFLCKIWLKLSSMWQHGINTHTYILHELIYWRTLRQQWHDNISTNGQFSLKTWGSAHLLPHPHSSWKLSTGRNFINRKNMVFTSTPPPKLFV
jgi:hypothetical protein